MGAEHISETRVGLWLVMAHYPTAGMLGLVDADGQWPASQVAARDCLWLPTAGKLKTWLRGRGYRVATGEAPTLLLGSSTATLRHVCRLTRVDGSPPVDGEGSSEAEALADAILRASSARTLPTPPAGRGSTRIRTRRKEDDTARRCSDSRRVHMKRTIHISVTQP